MPRGSRVRTVGLNANAQGAVPRVRRLNNLQNHLEKLNEKDSLTFEEDGVIFVHRCKKRPRLSAAEKEEV